MKRLLKSSIWTVIIGWLIAACNENTVYHTYQPIPTDGWEKSDTLFFNITFNDSLIPLNLTAEIRNESKYAYRNLYLAISHNLEDSTNWKTDTLLFVLADKEGKWYGTGWGSLFQSALPIGKTTTKHPGNYTLKVSHCMNDEHLKGVNAVGIKIEK